MSTNTDFFAGLENEAETGLVEVAAPVLILSSDPQLWAKEISERIPLYVASDPELLEMAAGITAISSEAGNAEAIRMGGLLKAEQMRAAAYCETYTSAAHALHGAVVGLRKRAIGPYEVALDNIKLLSLQWERHRDTLIRREAELKAAEQRKQDEQAALLRAEALEAEGKPAEAAKALERGDMLAQINQQTIMERAEAKIATPIKTEGSSKRKNYKPVYRDILELISEAAKNPAAYAQYLAFNEKVIGPEVRARGTLCEIPGVDVIEESSLSIKAAK